MTSLFITDHRLVIARDEWQHGTGAEILYWGIEMMAPSPLSLPIQISQEYTIQEWGVECESVTFSVKGLMILQRLAER